MWTKRAVRVFFVLALLAGGAACASATTAPTAQPATSASVASPTSPTVASSQATAANGYPYGYGTYYVATRRSVPPNWGNANAWYAHAQAAGYSVGDTPRKDAIAWTDRGPFGQVAIVEEVSDDGTQVTISEMNVKSGGWNRVTVSTVPTNAYKYIN
jgi:surface antigen